MNGTSTLPSTVSPSNRVDVLETPGGRILCVADVRGKLSLLNDLAKEQNASAVIHTGDFGFYEPSSLSKITDRTLKHLIQYSMAISPELRSSLMHPSLSPQQLRQMLINPHQPALDSNANSAAGNPSQFALSEFPKLLTGELKLNVPVYTVWGACEDVSVLEKLRIAAPGPVSFQASQTSAPALGGATNWSIPNLTVLSESSTRTLVIGGVRFRLFGLGGACVAHKMFDNGEGQATIAGGGGTMWTTILQIGELIDMAARVYDPAETRLLVTHASPGREGILAQLALALKADITISASLHFRYGVSYNEFSTQHDQEAYKNKFLFAKAAFNEIWDTVKPQVESVIDDGQRKFLNNALAVTSRVPGDASSGGQVEEAAWKNTWNWNLPDANFGSLVLDVRDGRVSSEQKSQGFNFSYRAGAEVSVPTGPSAKHSLPPKGFPQQQSNRPPSAPKAQQQQGSPQAGGYQGSAPSSKPFQQNHTFRKDSNRHPSKPESALPPQPQTQSHGQIDQPPSKPGSPKPSSEAAAIKDGSSTSPFTPQIDRPASSASSRRSSHYKAKSGPQDDPKPINTIENSFSESQDASGAAGSFRSGRGRGNRGRGDRGRSFDGGRSERGNLRGGRGGGRGGGKFEGGAQLDREAATGSPSQSNQPQSQHSLASGQALSSQAPPTTQAPVASIASPASTSAAPASSGTGQSGAKAVSNA